MEILTVSPGNKITIPQAVKERLGVKPGDRMIVAEREGVVSFIPVGDVKALRGRYPGISSGGIREESDR